MTSRIVDENEKVCYLCGGYGSDRHHCLHGSMRAKCEEDGLVVMLCRTCHRNLHDHRINDLYLQQLAERFWLDYTGNTVQDFIDRYGKNFL